MSFMNSIPSQLEAVKYVNRACRSLGYPDTVIGGHSKGGNLAVYGGAFCDDMAKRCITRIYSNDGPGFSKQVAESEEYKSVQDRIMRIIPQTSIVGMLFENPARCCVVQSNQRGVLQHDGFSWQVMGGKFVFLDNVTEDCRIIKNTISEWLEECTGEQLNEIVNALFTFLSSTDAATLTELSANTPKLLGSIRRMDSVNKKYLLRLVRLMAGVEKRKIRHEIQKQLFGQGGGH